MAPKRERDSGKLVAENRKARFNYEIEGDGPVVTFSHSLACSRCTRRWARPSTLRAPVQRC